MRIALIGPELEENLALRYIDAALAKAGHQTRIFDFHQTGQTASVAAEVTAFNPHLVGLSMVFTARAGQFLDLAQRLRQVGCTAHITAGGHFATFHAEKILREFPAFDSIVAGEGEQTMVDLAECLDNPGRVAGLWWRDGDWGVHRTPPREPLANLDRLAWPTRNDRQPAYLGLPIANMLSSRGCYGACSFCSIRAWHRQIGGAALRQRRAEEVAAEMARLYHERGVRIYNFHDDNFFLPDEADNIRRFEDLRDALNALGVGRIAIQVKARPDSVQPASMGLLKQMGLFRVFLGIESNAPAGLRALGRGIDVEQNRRALETLQGLDLHVTFNLLMFEPDCTLADVRQNVRMMRQWSAMPLNFCRTEVYAGTPLQSRLLQQSRLQGDWLGYDYRIADPAAQQAFEIFREVFYGRNFEMGGANLQAMSLDYRWHLLKRFHPRQAEAKTGRKVADAIRAVNESSAALMEEICVFCESPASGARVGHFVAQLKAERHSCDQKLTRRMQALSEAIEQQAQKGRRGATVFARRLASSAAALVLTAGLAGCDSDTAHTHPTEMAPKPAPVEPEPPQGEAEPPSRRGDAPQGVEGQLSKLPQLSEIDQLRVLYLLELFGEEDDDLRALGARHDAVGKEARVEIAIEADGTVSLARVIEVPGGNKALARDLEAWLRKQTLPRISAGGVTRATVRLGSRRIDTHMFEMAPTPGAAP